MSVVKVELGARSYPVIIESGLLGRAGGHLGLRYLQIFAINSAQ